MMYLRKCDTMVTNNNMGKRIIPIIIIVLFIILVCVLSYFFTNDKYLKKVKSYQLTSSALNKDDWGVLNNYQEYVSFIKENNIKDEILPSRFEEYHYLYYVLEVQQRCSENIVGFHDLDIQNGEVKIVADLKISCGECKPDRLVYLFKIDKDIDVNNVIFDYNVVSNEKCDSEVIFKKPILYLYPTEDTQISVKLEHPELLLTTYPKYNNGWNVFVKTNGDMYDASGKYYYGLYWDEVDKSNVNFKEGFYVTSDKAIDFLEEKLSIIGLSDRERNEFIMYWLPVLEKNKQSLVYFEFTDEIEAHQKLMIHPKPDSLLRVRIHIKKVSKYVDIKEEKLPTFVRNGFVAVEWGGSNYS